MKKSGFTLIEILTTLLISTVIFSIGIKGSRVYLKIRDDLRITQFLYEAEDIISFAKGYCISNSIAGDIYIQEDKGREVLAFKGKDIIQRQVILPEGIKVKKLDDEIYKSLYVNSDGVVESSTFIFIDKHKKIYKITIRPGGNIITVK